MCADGTAISKVWQPDGCTGGYLVAGGSTFQIVMQHAALRDSLTYETTYSVVVRAQNSEGIGWPSQVLTFTTKPVPEQPTNSTFLDRELQLTWPVYTPNGPSELPTNHQLRLVGTARNDTAYEQIVYTNAERAYNFTGLIPGRPYTIYVKAYLLSGGWSGESDPKEFWTKTAVPDAMSAPFLQNPRGNNKNFDWLRPNAAQIKWDPGKLRQPGLRCPVLPLSPLWFLPCSHPACLWHQASRTVRRS